MKVKVYEHHKPQLLATRKGAFFPSDAMNTHEYTLFFIPATFPAFITSKVIN